MKIKGSVSIFSAAFVSLAAAAWEVPLVNVKSVTVNGGGEIVVPCKCDGTAKYLVASNDVSAFYQDATGVVTRVVKAFGIYEPWNLYKNGSDSPIRMSYTNYWEESPTQNTTNLWVNANYPNVAICFDDTGDGGQEWFIFEYQSSSHQTFETECKRSGWEETYFTNSVESGSGITNHYVATRTNPTPIPSTSVVDRVFYASQTNALVFTETDPTATEKAKAAIIEEMCTRTNEYGTLKLNGIMGGINFNNTIWFDGNYISALTEEESKYLYFPWYIHYESYPDKAIATRQQIIDATNGIHIAATTNTLDAVLKAGSATAEGMTVGSSIIDGVQYEYDGVYVSSVASGKQHKLYYPNTTSAQTASDDQVLATKADCSGGSGGGSSFNPTNTYFYQSMILQGDEPDPSTWRMADTVMLYPGYMYYNYFAPGETVGYMNYIALPPTSGTYDDKEYLLGQTYEIFATRKWVNNIKDNAKPLTNKTYMVTSDIETLQNTLKQIITDLGGTWTK